MPGRREGTKPLAAGPGRGDPLGAAGSAGTGRPSQEPRRDGCRSAAAFHFGCDFSAGTGTRGRGGQVKERLVERVTGVTSFPALNSALWNLQRRYFVLLQVLQVEAEVERQVTPFS